MENSLTQVALFSGKFDPPHPGHFASICELGKKFGAVRVVLLDYPNRRYPVEYCIRVFKETFDCVNFPVYFHVNKTHFAEVTKEELDQFKPYHIYVAGNLKVLRHIESLGVPTYYQHRKFDYQASSIPMSGL